MSKLKSWWPGVSTRLKANASCSKLITAEETEMPRSRSTAIQSERTRRRAPWLLRFLTRRKVDSKTPGFDDPQCIFRRPGIE